MNDPGFHECTICSEEKTPNQEWFLIIENQWEDKLMILYWDEDLAAQSCVHAACSAAHVQELVIHWMTTGSLDYPFARTELAIEQPDCHEARIREAARGDKSFIAELAVDWESLRRVLRESPESLKTILDALLGALNPEIPEEEFNDENEGEAVPVLAREI